MTKLVLHFRNYVYDNGTTLQEVVSKLEKTYGILAKFAEVKEQEIVEVIESSIEDINGMKPNYNQAALDIADMFFNFIVLREAERVGLPHVPTVASLTGKGRKSGTPGPSFYDTGEYASSAVVDIEPS